MAKIDKLISKFNKVKSSINSIKGIASKIDSINYVSGIDSLGESAEAAYGSKANQIIFHIKVML